MVIRLEHFNFAKPKIGLPIVLEHPVLLHQVLVLHHHHLLLQLLRLQHLLRRQSNHQRYSMINS
jgi:hypothetical protein